MPVGPLQTTTVVFLLALAAGGCSSEPPAPGEEALEDASRKITSEKEGVAHGNTQGCRARAELYETTIRETQAVMFEGGKSHRLVSLTGEKFLVYCHHSSAGVAFLVHVPQFKRYKGEVRSQLIRLAWEVAEMVTTDLAARGELQLGVALRGSLMYGAIAVGRAGAEPTYTVEDRRVEPTPIYPLFVAPDAANIEMPADVRAAVAGATRVISAGPEERE